MKDVGKILLVSAEWKTRAMLMAEFKEAGYQVTALPGATLALRALTGGQVSPDLVLLDATSDPDASPAQVRQMVRVLGELPLVLLVGAYDAAEFEPLRDQVAAYLTRPVQIRHVVATVHELI